MLPTIPALPVPAPPNWYVFRCDTGHRWALLLEDDGHPIAHPCPLCRGSAIEYEPTAVVSSQSSPTPPKTQAAPVPLPVAVHAEPPKARLPKARPPKARPPKVTQGATREDVGLKLRQRTTAPCGPMDALRALAKDKAGALGWLPASAIVTFADEYGWDRSNVDNETKTIKGALDRLVEAGEWSVKKEKRPALFRPGRIARER